MGESTKQRPPVSLFSRDTKSRQLMDSKIFDQVIENAELPWTMEDAYAHNAGAEEIAEMIAKRRDLCKLRLVARGWKHGGKWRSIISQRISD